MKNKHRLLAVCTGALVLAVPLSARADESDSFQNFGGIVDGATTAAAGSDSFDTQDNSVTWRATATQSDNFQTGSVQTDSNSGTQSETSGGSENTGGDAGGRRGIHSSSGKPPALVPAPAPRPVVKRPATPPGQHPTAGTPPVTHKQPQSSVKKAVASSQPPWSEEVITRPVSRTTAGPTVRFSAPERSIFCEKFVEDSMQQILWMLLLIAVVCDMAALCLHVRENRLFHSKQKDRNMRGHRRRHKGK